MATILIDPQVESPSEDPPRKKWTRAECEVLEAAGLLDLHHLELIEGDLIDKKMSKNPPHINALAWMYAWLLEIFGKGFVVSEGPIDVAPDENTINDPEPDLIVLKRSLVNFDSSRPKPQDLHMVIEISDTTLNFDLRTKARLYARASIPEYWVLDVARRRLIVHRNPEAGRYTSVLVYGEHEAVAPLAAPHAEFRATQVFPRK